jgi:TRAP-type C4-dicarboxylate transport system permease small subunit
VTTPDPTVIADATETIASTPGDATLPRPRVRTGAVVWGLLLVALSAAALWTVADTGRRAAAVDAVTALDGFGWTVVAVVTFGGILTLIALAAVIRQIQHRLARRETGQH